MPQLGLCKAWCWSYFQETLENGSKVVACQLCPTDKRKTYKFHSSTFMMVKHIEKKHSAAHKAQLKEKLKAQQQQYPHINKIITFYAPNSPQATKITHQIAKFIAVDCRPIAIIDGVGFCELMHATAPRYSIPDRHEFVGILKIVLFVFCLTFQISIYLSFIERSVRR